MSLARLPSRLGVPVLFVLVLVGLAPPTSATGVTVSVQDFSFTPARVTVGLGTPVTWQFHSMHTSTSNQRFWNSGVRSSGGFTVTFLDAGSFGYHCTMHPSMTGVVRVPLRATGTSAGGWRVRWSVRTTTPSNRRFDVQFKRAGTSTWKWFRSATAKRSAFFDPAGSGTYVFRARTRNVGVGASSWSPSRSVTIS